MIAVFVLVDAMGWAYLKDRSFLPEVFTYRKEVRTVLGFSSGAIPTILSGKLPQESGRWNLFYFNPAHSPFRWVRYFAFLPSRLLNTRVVRRGVRFLSQRLSRFGGYFQIYGVPVELLPYFDVSEKKDIYRPGGVPHSIFDRLESMGVRYRTYSYHQLSDAEIIRTAHKDLRDRKYDFHFLYLAELDAFLHRWCREEARVDAELKRYEKWLADLYQAACEAEEDVAFFVFSDHGMTPKRSGFDLIGAIESLGFKMPADYIALYDSTMARFWFFNDQARQAIHNRLSTLECGHVLSVEEKRGLGIEFDDLRYGETIFLLNPGVLIEPSFMGTRAPNGMHGFHPDDLYSSAALLGNRDPGRPVRILTDLYDLMLDWAEATQEVIHAS